MIDLTRATPEERWGYVQAMLERMDGKLDAQTLAISDHERRLRPVERRTWFIVWLGPVVLGFFVFLEKIKPYLGMK